MSHFSVLVCVPGDTDLAKLDDHLADVMAPWDENLAAEPYRDYEDGSPDEFWWVRSIRRGAEHYRNGTGIRPYDPNTIGWSTHGTVKETPERQRAAFADDARQSERLGENPTWETVVKLYNEQYHPGTELAVVGDDSDSERMHYDPETGRAYTVSTFNQERKWDYWRIGGRWRGYFVAKEPVSGLIYTEKDWDSPDENATPGVHRCDGGPIEALDFEAMRTDAEREAHKRYDEWEAVSAEHPPAKSWEHFYGLAEAGAITWDQARLSYREQPLIRAWWESITNQIGKCPVAEFLSPREEYVADARRGAVPGYALVTLEHEWVAPGRMGWFGMSTDGPGERAGYHVAANQYLDQVDPATILVVLDCHI